MHVVARVAQAHPSLATQLFVPGGVYLHEAIVEGPVCIVVDGRRVETAFSLRDGPEKLRGYPELLACLFKAKRANMMGSEEYEGDREGKRPGRTDIASPMYAPFHREGITSSLGG